LDYASVRERERWKKVREKRRREGKRPPHP